MSQTLGDQEYQSDEQIRHQPVMQPQHLPRPRPRYQSVTRQPDIAEVPNEPRPRYQSVTRQEVEGAVVDPRPRFQSVTRQQESEEQASDEERMVIDESQKDGNHSFIDSLEVD